MGFCCDTQAQRAVLQSATSLTWSACLITAEGRSGLLVLPPSSMSWVDFLVWHVERRAPVRITRWTGDGHPELHERQLGLWAAERHVSWWLAR